MRVNARISCCGVNAVVRSIRYVSAVRAARIRERRSERTGSVCGVRQGVASREQIESQNVIAPIAAQFSPSPTNDVSAVRADLRLEKPIRSRMKREFRFPIARAQE